MGDPEVSRVGAPDHHRAQYSVNTERFVDDGSGRVRALVLHEVQMVEGRFQKVEGTDREIPADFVFLSMKMVTVSLTRSLSLIILLTLLKLILLKD